MARRGVARPPDARCFADLVDGAMSASTESMDPGGCADISSVLKPDMLVLLRSETEVVAARRL